MERLERKLLEADVEAWFQYYFPHYCTAPAANFHREATQRVVSEQNWYEVRRWSRYLGVTTRTKMEVLYVLLTGKKKSVLIASSTQKSAEKILSAYMHELEHNQRLIEDYGHQIANVILTAIGVDVSLCGVPVRPDVVLFIEIDTEINSTELVTIERRWHWALRTSAVYDHLCLVIWCGHAFGEDSCIKRAQKNADIVSIVNIVDQNGISTWPEKNSDAHIAKLMGVLPFYICQREYFNNPL
jgi:hypothetical protein